MHGKETRTPKDCRSRRVCGWGHFRKIASFMKGFRHCSQTQEDAYVYFGLDRLS
jgi:hypothetical protein